MGTVVSTQNSGPYTYVELDIKGSSVWYAVPATELNPGDTVVAPAGMPMKDFYSKTLDRTFDTVYFADGIGRAGSMKESDALPAGHPPIHSVLPADHPPIQTALPPDHPPLNTATNSACCTKQSDSAPSGEN